MPVATKKKLGQLRSVLTPESPAHSMGADLRWALIGRQALPEGPNTQCSSQRTEGRASAPSISSEGWLHRKAFANTNSESPVSQDSSRSTHCFWLRLLASPAAALKLGLSLGVAGFQPSLSEPQIWQLCFKKKKCHLFPVLNFNFSKLVLLLKDEEIKQEEKRLAFDVLPRQGTPILKHLMPTSQDSHLQHKGATWPAPQSLSAQPCLVRDWSPSCCWMALFHSRLLFFPIKSFFLPCKIYLPKNSPRGSQLSPPGAPTWCINHTFSFV